jgi:hypothetical protein
MMMMIIIILTWSGHSSSFILCSSGPLALCNLLGGYQHAKGTFRTHLFWRWRRYVPWTHSYPFTRIRVAIWTKQIFTILELKTFILVVW